ncbi:hypothetical protein CPLU01_00653 [Colletotrichum plurivorum]|uniref:Uncharacterized protein n=1 Tax=Colletotrichum plurivorum TaxID=2175906 RepID=A0A8H6NR83_9PEZI|nr:hypothetical protein CPLU01_00653 [Colletotrichum plurivorum]
MTLGVYLPTEKEVREAELRWIPVNSTRLDGPVGELLHPESQNHSAACRGFVPDSAPRDRSSQGQLAGSSNNSVPRDLQLVFFSLFLYRRLESHCAGYYEICSAALLSLDDLGTPQRSVVDL